MRILKTRSFLIAFILFLAVSVFAEDALDQWYFRDARVVNKVRFVNGLFIGVGDNGVILTSTNGQNWTARNSSTTANLRDVAYGNFLFPNGASYIAVGANATILTSSNTIDWSSVATGNTCDLNGVAFGASTCVAVATRLTSSQPNVLRSNDGMTWTPVTFSDATPDPYFRMDSIIAVGGFFMAAGSPSIADSMLRSVGGSSWQNAPVTGGVIDVMGIAYGNGRAIAIGYEGNPLVSTNVGPSQTWFASPTNWCVIDGTCLQANDIVFGNGTFLAAKPFGTGTLTTTNGLQWTKRSALSGFQIETLAFGNGTFIAAGGNGIYQSEPVSTPGLSLFKNSSSNAINVTVAGEIGRGYRLQTSTNLSDWFDHSSFTNTSPFMEFVEPITNSFQLFYRAVTP